LGNDSFTICNPDSQSQEKASHQEKTKVKKKQRISKKIQKKQVEDARFQHVHTLSQADLETMLDLP
jgi:hypothetical protein